MNIDFWLKNPKANFQNGEMNISTAITMNYEQKAMNYENKNKANQTQFQCLSKPNKAKTKPIKPNL